MSETLVERLRDPRGFDWGDFCALTMEAANEIERLKALLAASQEGESE